MSMKEHAQDGVKYSVEIIRDEERDTIYAFFNVDEVDGKNVWSNLLDTKVYINGSRW